MGDLIKTLIFLSVGAVGGLVTLPLLPAGVQGLVETGQSKVEAVRGIIQEPNTSLAAGPGLAVPAPEEGSTPQIAFTIDSIYPIQSTGEDECLIAPPCLSTRISNSAPSHTFLVFNMTVRPLNVQAATEYTLVLTFADGAIRREQALEWAADDLVGVGEGNRSVKALEDMERAQARDVQIHIRYDDISVPPFIEQYNRMFDEALDKYEQEILDEYCLDGVVANNLLFPCAVSPEALKTLEPEPFELTQEQMKAVIADHYTIALVNKQETARVEREAATLGQ